MSVVDQQDEIVTQLKTIAFGPTSISVTEGATGDQEMKEIIAGVGEKPFIVVNFAGFSQTARRMKHMTGAKYNSREAIFSVTCVANTDRETRQVWEKVLEKMEGFEPTNAGEIEPALFASTGAISFLGSPTRFTSIQTFTFISNSFTA